MKKMKTLLITLTAASLLLVACGGKNSQENAKAETAPETEQAQVNETQETQADETQESQTEETAAIEAEEDSALAEKPQFIVDVTDSIPTDEGYTIIGNTASDSLYSGIIEIHVAPTASLDPSSIKPGQTYVFTTEEMMTMSIPPQVTATAFVPATEEDIVRLENTRANVSNYESCMESYQDMTLEDIIMDANFNYALWTQDEIAQYIDFIEEKGYAEDSGIKSYVKQRDQLNGSIASPDEGVNPSP